MRNAGISRREFLATVPAAAAARPLAAAEGGRKRIAALISEYRPNSHADVIIGKMLAGYYYAGQHHEPKLQVVSMYTDLVPDEDMTRDLAAQYRFKLLPSIREAITMTSNSSAGPRKIAVDGIVSICEHGAYPYNSLGQKMYPRYEFFKQIVDVFRETGQTVPVFNDKHLSYDWYKAKWMYDQSRELKFPFIAGSVEPRAVDGKLLIPMGTRLDRALGTWEATFFDSKDSYGFHALEMLQCKAERREGGETGIAAVQCFEGPSVWEWTEAHPWASGLLNEVMRASNASAGRLSAVVRNPLLFVLEYNDGLQAVVYRLNGAGARAGFAALEKGGSRPMVQAGASRQMPELSVPPELRQRYRVNSFTMIVRSIEEMIETGKPPQPVERTLLTTGALAALHESSIQPSPMYGRSLQHPTHIEKGRRVETPHLAISYRV